VLCTRQEKSRRRSDYDTTRTVTKTARFYGRGTTRGYDRRRQRFVVVLCRYITHGRTLCDSRPRIVLQTTNKRSRYIPIPYTRISYIIINVMYVNTNDLRCRRWHGGGGGGTGDATRPFASVFTTVARRGVIILSNSCTHTYTFTHTA